MPGNLKGAELEDFIRNAASTYWHETCTAKIGRDDMSVVDSRLKVYGIENLRIADGSTLPSIPTGNTMASCVIVGDGLPRSLGEHTSSASMRSIRRRNLHEQHCGNWRACEQGQHTRRIRDE